MTIKYIDVVQEQVTAANVSIYTAPTSATFESAHIVFSNCTNNDTVDTELTVHLVQFGSTAVATNVYFPAKVIFAGQSDPLTTLMGAGLKSGDIISSVASLASNLNLKLKIKEIFTD